jgi:hypothetical protein
MVCAILPWFCYVFSTIIIWGSLSKYILKHFYQGRSIMVQTLPKTQFVTFEEFIKWKPEGGFYELYDGEITKDESAIRKTRKQNWVFNDRV